MELSITAKDQTKVLETMDPALTYTITTDTLIRGDIITRTLTRDAGETIGDYAINQGSVTINGNYDLTFVPGTLTVTDLLKQTIVFNPLTDRAFGDADFNITATGGASGSAVTFSSSNTFKINTDLLSIIAMSHLLHHCSEL